MKEENISADLRDNLRVPFNALSPKTMEFLKNLDENSFQIWRYWENFKPILEKFEKEAIGLIAKSGIGDEISRKIVEESFNSLISIHIKKLYSTLEDKVAGLFSTETILNGAASILEGIKSFEDKINKLYPDLSDVILKSLENTTLGIISGFVALAPLADKAKELLDSCREYLKPNNLEASIENFRAKAEKIKDEKSLEGLSKSDPERVALAKDAELGLTQILRVGLHGDEAKNFREASEKGGGREENKNFIIECSKIIPKDQSDLDKRIGSIKENLEKTIKEAKLIDEKGSLKRLEEALTKMGSDLKGVFDNKKTLTQKLSILKEAAEEFSKLKIDFKGSKKEHSGPIDFDKKLKNSIKETNLSLSPLRSFSSLPAVQKLGIEKIVSKNVPSQKF